MMGDIRQFSDTSAEQAVRADGVRSSALIRPASFGLLAHGVHVLLEYDLLCRCRTDDPRQPAEMGHPGFTPCTAVDAKDWQPRRYRLNPSATVNGTSSRRRL